ncbi:hypothetical protein FKR81_05690 [Lentzea tibetensis]|uniref:Uncharacterized protein n=1 Tax=Lentzea tibetensis TaxID=2591470 RepID=A0A563F0D9_9PSEU|nr:hypothetical protein [Lentzea tibetensis]TWP53446.1 hypothetical protein FKR81_05690 [Lentzea tibetensis]
MQLKDAFEAVTENVDVRPGFLGDVMTGARRRRTRKLVITTAVVALIAGGVAGVVLTRAGTSEVSTTDERFALPTRGELASDQQFLDGARASWRTQTPSAMSQRVDSPEDAPTHVLWAGNTPAGKTAVVLQAQHADKSWATSVGLVVNDQLISFESQTAENPQHGVFQFGPKDSVFLVLERSVPVQHSMRATRGQDGALSREWRPLTMTDGVAVVTAEQGDKPLFVLAQTPPPPDDFNLDQQLLYPRTPITPQRAYIPYTGLGWNDRRFATAEPEYLPSGTVIHDLYETLHRARLVDYRIGSITSGQWHVIAALPGDRTALVTEFENQLYAVIYGSDGSLQRTIVGPPVLAGGPLPVRFHLPDGLGIVLADYGSGIGPDGKSDAWLAPANTGEVQVMTAGSTTVVPLN